jgi:hypothetical protein
MNSGGFPAVAPYLKDPLVLIGFFLFLAFLFLRYLISQKIIPPLPPGPGFRILKTILLYGFIIGLLLIALGFAFKYRELVGQEKQATLDRELRRRTTEAAERQAAEDRAERERQRSLEAANKHQEQINTVKLLREEMNSNLKSVDEMRNSTAVALKTMLSVAQVLRTPGIKILPILFPAENLDPKFTGTAALGGTVMDKLDQTGLANDRIESHKFTLAGRAIAATVDQTIATIHSLSDKDQKRYPISIRVWNQYLPVFRDIDIIDVTKFQKCYADLTSARANFDIIQSQFIDYLESVRAFFRPQDNKISREGVSKVLTSEHLAIQLAGVYGNQLVADLASIKKLNDQITISFHE